MFNGFMKSKFYKKSKTAIKVTKMRLETIKKKRAAIERYLRKDMADLLRNDLDINAYGRAKGLLVERNMTSCYDFVDRFCGCISSDHIVAMQKQREAVSSLMYAAARFADLPELRELRTLFKEKYRDSLDSFINEEFAGRLRSKPSSEDMKLELMRDVAAEFSVDWKYKALEQRLKERSEKGLDSYPRDSSRDNSEKSTSSSSEDDVTEAYGKATNYGISKRSSSSSSSPSDDEAMQKRPPSYRDITPPYVKSKVDTVDSVQDKPKPRSVRQRRSKPPPGFEFGATHANEVDREEKETDKVKGAWKLPHSRGKAADDKEEEEDTHMPARVSSLPLETTMAPEEENETGGKGHRRSASLQPEVLVGHVHPNLPNYDNLAARLAVLRGR